MTMMLFLKKKKLFLNHIQSKNFTNRINSILLKKKRIEQFQWSNECKNIWLRRRYKNFFVKTKIKSKKWKWIWWKRYQFTKTFQRRIRKYFCCYFFFRSKFVFVKNAFIFIIIINVFTKKIFINKFKFNFTMKIFVNAFLKRKNSINSIKNKNHKKIYTIDFDFDDQSKKKKQNYNDYVKIFLRNHQITNNSKQVEITSKKFTNQSKNEKTSICDDDETKTTKSNSWIIDETS